MTGIADLADDLRLREVRALRGPNLWLPRPATTAEVEEGGLAAHAPSTQGDVAQRLASALAIASGEGARTGSLAVEADAWPELVLAVAVALLRAVRAPSGHAAVVRRGGGEAPLLVLEADEEALGVETLREAAALVRAALRGEEDGGGAVAGPVVERLREVYREARPRATLRVMLEAARRRGIPVRRFGGEAAVQLGLGRNLRRLDATMTDRTSVIATDVTSDKDRTKHVLRRFGIPVPEGDVARTEEEAVEIAADLGFPVLLKPLDANDGRGISGRLDTAEAVRAAWPVAVAEHPRVVVERYAEGRDHRVVVVAGRVVAVSERIPAHVVGDGRRTVRELAEERNRDPKRDPHNPDATLRRIPLDELTGRHLARAGLTLDSVPAAGERVTLRATANISTGGTSVDRTGEIHPRNAALCELAAGAVGLDVAGLDVLSADISVPFSENGAVVIEVNASPGIRMHTDPDRGEPRDVPGAILDMLYPPGSEATIPVLAVTGTNGKTTTTRLLAHLFGQGGRRVGFTTTDGVYFDGQLLMRGDLTGPFAAGIILSHPRVDVAVLETARGGILRSGLGYDACDVGVVLNVSSDHLGLRGIHTVEDLARVKAVIPSVVKPTGHAVLNADQPLVLAMREGTPGQVVLFSARGEENPEVAAHLAGGGIAAVLEAGGDGRESVVLRRGDRRETVAAVEDVPVTVGGAARFQLENVLAVAAAAGAWGMPVEEIRAGLLSFVPSGASMPGRMNVLRTARGPVVVDYAHNPAAVRAVVEFARRLPARRRIGVIAMPGDRRDEDLRELGREAAALDRVIVKEHEHYRRGRPEGETARLIGAGLEEGGLSPEAWEMVLPEPEAVARALEVMEEGDVVVVLADDTDAVLAQVAPLVVEG